MRDAAYEALPKDLRADYHARFADWIDGASRRGRNDLGEIVGWHPEQAHRYFVELGPFDERGQALGRRAADQLSVAGSMASERGDVSAGGSLRFRALQLMTTGDERRPLILGELGEALVRSGRFDEADEDLTQAIALSELAGDEMLRMITFMSPPRGSTR